MTIPDLSIEKKYPGKIVVGIDEAGRGAWVGPVVVGAVIINPEKDLSYINDSKKISKEKRSAFSKQILAEHICAVGMASPEEISELGLNPAIFLSINRALTKLEEQADIAIIDGNYKIDDLQIPYYSIIKGDSLSVSIAAASIIAKVYRDNLLEKLSKEFPEYGWDKNAGYGTKLHSQAILQYSICDHHRKNYKPIKKILDEI